MGSVFGEMLPLKRDRHQDDELGMNRLPLTFSFPVTRYGRVCVADRELSMEESERLADTLVKEWKRFQEPATNAWEKTIAYGGKLIWQPGDAGKVYREAAPIVRLPEIYVEYSGFVLRVRLHLTICRLSANSKVWSRVALADCRRRSPYRLDFLTVQDFLRLSNEASQEVTYSLAEVYRGFFEEIGYTKDFDVPFDISINAVNTGDEKICDLLWSIRLGEYQRMADLLEDENRARVLADFLHLANFDTTGPSPKALVAASGTESRWQVQLAEEYTGLYFVALDSESIRYTGLAYSPLLDYSSQLPSLQSSRVIAQDIAPVL